MKTYIELDKQDLEALERVATLLCYSERLTSHQDHKRILKDLSFDLHVLAEQKDNFLACDFILFNADYINENVRFTDVV